MLPLKITIFALNLTPIKNCLMKSHLIHAMAAALAMASTIFCSDVAARDLVILHTNDTHSQIDPTTDNLGGVARRMVLIDSVRQARKNVMLIDAGDVVQGTLYFNLYGGKVEQQLMNRMGYDIRILGNHEFDNGVDSLAAVLAPATAEFLSTNYDLDGTALAAKFKRYAIREFEGRRIGFMGINLDPDGMIFADNSVGVIYRDAVEWANHTAWWLRNIEKCDMVIAITHIGYSMSVAPDDCILAKESHGIDVIIGAHSHTVLNPAVTVKNADGRDVLVTQTGKSGKFLGELDIDLDNLTASERLIPVDSRLDSRIDPRFSEELAPYAQGVDSLMTKVKVGRTASALDAKSAALLNWCTDYVLHRGRQIASDVDFAILNKGGIRNGLPKGTITEGQIICMLPFTNRVQVIDVKGCDLLEAFRIMAVADGNGVSAGVDITYHEGTAENKKKDAYVVSAMLNGKPFDPDNTYRVATINYVAEGNDDMKSLRNHTLVAESPNILFNDILDYLRYGAGKNKTIKPSNTVRMHPDKK